MRQVSKKSANAHYIDKEQYALYIDREQCTNNSKENLFNGSLSRTHVHSFTLFFVGIMRYL